MVLKAAALDLGYRAGVPAAAVANAKIVYLLGADAAAPPKSNGAFVVYQGHHGDAGAARADVVFPGAAYTEKDATFVNTGLFVYPYVSKLLR